jgi:hypothetical protein
MAADTATTAAPEAEKPEVTSAETEQVEKTQGETESKEAEVGQKRKASDEGQEEGQEKEKM